VKIDEIRELYHAAPFEPLELVLTNGRTVDVPLIIATKTFDNGSKPRKRKQ
jgi:hypothetical protein